MVGPMVAHWLKRIVTQALRVFDKRKRPWSCYHRCSTEKGHHPDETSLDMEQGCWPLATRTLAHLAYYRPVGTYFLTDSGFA
jgi:hypothetical protein